MENHEKKRHGFVTFWLWLMIIGNIISGIILISEHDMATWIYASEAKQQEFFYVNHATGDYFRSAMLFLGCISFLNAVGAILLLKWKRNGFWFFVASAIVTFGVMCTFASLGGMTPTVTQSMLGAIAGPAILYAILQLKKDGLSCWSQLE